MINGIKVSTGEGTPQGGPLSPLLANIMLDELDKELEKRGHKFCRYADDCNIYVKKQVCRRQSNEEHKEIHRKQIKTKSQRSKKVL
ncbi:RNA-directed DNA polymerase (Reverse transcriptase) [Thermoanaerobacter ethanolicus JW 200]|nr:RNA-directed DNA polymerase (Reverse transcriptase) [Thermoanaerobacter ethanolicus JW 200]